MRCDHGNRDTIAGKGPQAKECRPVEKSRKNSPRTFRKNAAFLAH